MLTKNFRQLPHVRGSACGTQGRQHRDVSVQQTLPTPITSPTLRVYIASSKHEEGWENLRQ